MKKLFNNRWFLVAVRLCVGLVFLYAGYIKIINPLAFADSIATFQMLPAEFINLLALSLPPFEIILGILLITGQQRRTASLAAILLCLIFAIALGQALIRNIEVDCGCFGSGSPSPFKTWASLGRDILLLIASSFLYRRYSQVPIEECSKKAPSLASVGQ